MTASNVLTTAQRIQRHLGRGHGTEIAILTAGISASDAVLTFGVLPSSVAKGVVLALDFELVLVTDTNVTAASATVVRGYLGSVSAIHGTSTIVQIAPRFSLLDVADAMQAEVAGWDPRGLYRVEDQTLTAPVGSKTLQLPVEWAQILGVVALHQSEITMLTTVWPDMGARLIRGTAAGFTGASTSGALLRFTESVRSGSVHVAVALAFDSTLVADPTKDLITDVKLTPGLIDVLELGTQRRLVANDTETKTSRSSQDEPRRAEETPLGSWLGMSQLQIALYRSRVAQEIARCRSMYPLRMV